MDRRRLIQAVCFAILMENNDGIMGKSPMYIEEKIAACASEPFPEMLLDSCNQAKLANWKMLWLGEDDGH